MTLDLYQYSVHDAEEMPLLKKRVCLFVVYLTTLFHYLRLYSVDVGGKPATSAQFLLNPDSSARASSSEAGETWVRKMAAESLPTRHLFHALRVLLHAVNLRHGTDGFTSPPKEGVLRIFITLKKSIVLDRV
jgi:hypothetical protein